MNSDDDFDCKKLAGIPSLTTLDKSPKAKIDKQDGKNNEEV